MGYRCSKSLFRDIPRTVPEKVRISGFKSNSSNLDRAAKMRDSVLLNCSDSFPAILPSVISETCVKNSSVILESNVLCAWMSLVFSCVSFETTANFYLYFNVAIILEERTKLNSCENWICSLFLNRIGIVIQDLTPFFKREIVSESSKAKIEKKWQRLPQQYQRHKCSNKILVLSFLLLIPSPWR